MKQVSNLLLKTARQLFDDLDERQSFVDAVIDGQSLDPSIIWTKAKPTESPFQVKRPYGWQPEFVDRLVDNQAPSQHSLHQSGHYYCFDSSAVFAASPLLDVPIQTSLAIDMCAAPGGKSMFTWRALRPRRLLCNEVKTKQVGGLIANLKRCGVSPSAVLHNDSRVFAEVIPATAQVVVVDAPCSKQAVLAKGGQSPGCFHPVYIQKQVKRQQRILTNSVQLVAPEGYLLYSTTTFAPEENEAIVEWLLETFPQFQPVVVDRLTKYQSTLSDVPCYRLFPQSGLGAGAFTALLKNTRTGVTRSIPQTFFDQPSVTLL